MHGDAPVAGAVAGVQVVPADLHPGPSAVPLVHVADQLPGRRIDGDLGVGGAVPPAGPAQVDVVVARGRQAGCPTCPGSAAGGRLDLVVGAVESGGAGGADPGATHVSPAGGLGGGVVQQDTVAAQRGAADGPVFAAHVPAGAAHRGARVGRFVDDGVAVRVAATIQHHVAGASVVVGKGIALGHRGAVGQGVPGPQAVVELVGSVAGVDRGVLAVLLLVQEAAWRLPALEHEAGAVGAGVGGVGCPALPGPVVAGAQGRVRSGDALGAAHCGDGGMGRGWGQQGHEKGRRQGRGWEKGGQPRAQPEASSASAWRRAGRMAVLMDGHFAPPSGRVCTRIE